MNLRYLGIPILLFVIFGCSIAGNSINKALTTSANVQLDPIDSNKAIVKYDYGALIEASGKEIAEKRMREFCISKEYRTILSGSRLSGEKKYTVTTVFECIE